jgi:hypothetical protein
MWSRAIVEWWRQPAGPPPMPLARDFVYDDGIVHWDAEEWLQFVRQAPGAGPTSSSLAPLMATKPASRSSWVRIQ